MQLLEHDRGIGATRLSMCEAVYLGPDRRSRLLRPDVPARLADFVAFDALRIDCEDLTDRAAARVQAPPARRDATHRFTPPVSGSRPRSGVDLFAKIGEQGREGIVAKWSRGWYLADGVQTW